MYQLVVDLSEKMGISINAAINIMINDYLTKSK